MKKWVFVALVCFPLFGSADETSKQAYISGAGALSCGAWIESKGPNATHVQHKQWVEGFLSGYNYYTNAKQAMPVDREAIYAYIDKYCSNNPLHRLAWAAAALVQDLGGLKAPHKWKE